MYQSRTRFTEEQVRRAVELYELHGPRQAADLLADSDVSVSPSTLTRWAQQCGARVRRAAGGLQTREVASRPTSELAGGAAGGSGHQ